MISIVEIIVWFPERGTKRSYIFYIMSFVILIPNLVLIIENWMHAKAYASMVNDISESIDCLEFIGDRNIFISNFVQHFYRKLVYCALIFSIELITRISLYADHLTYYLTSFTSITLLYKNMAILHIVFYIDLDNLVLSALNSKLNPIPSDYKNESLIVPVQTTEIKATLEYIKTIYLKVSKISNNINKSFGWFILVSVIHSILSLVRAGTGLIMILLNVNLLYGNLIIIRK